MTSSFNSKLVRLKVSDYQTRLPQVLCFNSKLVRLKASRNPSHEIRPDKFQFQTGAIKRAPLPIPSSLPAMFQFQTGAIKSSKFISSTGGVTRFNSKLVRLKGSVSIRRGTAISTFQFQTGAIKSSIARRRSVFCKVSIPNWCD